MQGYPMALRKSNISEISVLFFVVFGEQWRWVSLVPKVRKNSPVDPHRIIGYLKSFFNFFRWIVVMAFTFIFSLILWLMIGNLLYYMQVIVLRQKNPQVNSSPVVRSQSFNVSDLFFLFWSRGGEGIRVSLSEELTGGNGVFSD